MRQVTFLALGLAGLLAACGSPEATRMREGGHGADVGNRGSVVIIHGGNDPYWHTPRVDEPSGSGARVSRR